MTFEECYKLIQPEINNKFPYREGKRTFTEIFEEGKVSEKLEESTYEKLYEAYAVDERVLVPLTEQEAVYLIGQLEEGQEISDIDMQRLSEAFHPLGWMANTFAPNSAAANAYRQAKSAKDSIKRQYKQAKKQNKINQYLDRYYKDDLKNKYAQAQQQITQKQIPLSNEMQNLLKPGRIQTHSMGQAAIEPGSSAEFPEYPATSSNMSQSEELNKAPLIQKQQVFQQVPQQPIVQQSVQPVPQQETQPQVTQLQKPFEEKLKDAVSTAVEKAKKVSNTENKQPLAKKRNVAKKPKTEEIHLPESLNQVQPIKNEEDSYLDDFRAMMQAANA